jgi:hypothetical protein
MRNAAAYLPLSLSLLVSDDEVDDEVPGDDMLLLDALPLVVSVLAPDVLPVPDVPAAPDVPEDDDVSVDGVVGDEDDDGDVVDGLMVPVLDELELDGGVVLGVVVVVELELEAGGVVGVVVLVFDSRLQPTRPSAAAMAIAARGLAFMRILRKAIGGTVGCDPCFSRINAMRTPERPACTGPREPVQR